MTPQVKGRELYPRSLSFPLLYYEGDAGLRGGSDGAVGLSAGSSVSAVHAERPSRAPAHRPGQRSEGKLHPQVAGWLLHVVSPRVVLCSTY